VREQITKIIPGDAILLSLLMKCPLLLSDELANMGISLQEGQTPELYHITQFLKYQGITLPSGKKLRLGLSKTPMRDMLIKEFKLALAAKAPPFPESDIERRKKELLEFLNI